jgi:hypothetical protein
MLTIPRRAERARSFPPAPSAFTPAQARPGFT